MFINKQNIEKFKDTNNLTKDLVQDFIAYIKDDTGRVIMSDFILNKKNLIRAYLFASFFYQLDYKSIIENITTLKDDDFAQSLLKNPRKTFSIYKPEFEKFLETYTIEKEKVPNIIKKIFFE